MGAADRSAHPDVRNEIGVLDVAQRAGQHGFGEVQAPAAVGVQLGLECQQLPCVIKAHRPAGQIRVPLAGHGQVLGTVQPQPHRASGERGPERRYRRVAVGLHLLAAESPAHPQALHRDRAAGQPQHVRYDLLRLGGVLGAALDEHLPGLVNVGQRRVRFQVEVLLPAALELAAVDVRGLRQPRRHVAAPQSGPRPLERLLFHGFPQRHGGRQRFVLRDDGLRPQPRGVFRFGQHPADRLPVEHDLGWAVSAHQQRLVALDPGVVDARHVVGSQDTDHAGNAQCRRSVQPCDAGVGVRGLERPGVQQPGHLDAQVVGVQRRPGDVQRGALVRDSLTDCAHGRTFVKARHAVASASVSSAKNFSSVPSSMAAL